MPKIILATAPRAKGDFKKASLLLKKFYDYWMILVKFLGRINTFILLTIVYFLIIGPLAIFLKLFKKDLLNIRFPGTESSYWLMRETKDLTKNDYERLF